MTNARRRVALKVDCDTFVGTREGLPRLLDIFARRGVRASFFFTLGPDTSGRAVIRAFTRRGFLRKMLRTNAPALYGLRTMFSGTLLPAPLIGNRLGPLIRSVAEAGHEVGVHGWDHVRWHDRIDRMTPEAVRRDFTRAHDVFAEIFGRRARASAAPGWHATAVSLALQEEFGLRYASDTRGGPPFFPSVGGRTFRCLEIPTTLPTWDEVLGTPGFRSPEETLNRYAEAVRGDEVHTIHTEVEGRSQADLFEQLLQRWRADGTEFFTLESLAEERLADPVRPEAREIHRIEIPFRAGFVTSAQEGGAQARVY